MALENAKRSTRRLLSTAPYLSMALCAAILVAGCSTATANQTGPSRNSTATTRPTPSPTSTPTPHLGVTLPPGSILPTEAGCAQVVPVSAWEPRPTNKVPNAAKPTAAQLAGLAPWNATEHFDPRADALRTKITGNYTGTTDMILQWAACVWGIDPNIVRAQTALESSWYQLIAGDPTSDYSQCPPNPSLRGTLCYETYGIAQVKWEYNQSAWPMVRDDTAFNVEYVFGLIRACYEGYDHWLGNGYQAGDLWGCLGVWYSGNWHDAGANHYISVVQGIMVGKNWMNPNF